MKRILVLAHRSELIYQAVAHAKRAGLTAGVEMGTDRAGFEKVIVSTVQTQTAFSKCPDCNGGGCPMCSDKGKVRRFTKFNPHKFGLLIIDEAHHATAESYRLLIEWYSQNPELKILLVTATPKRSDGVGLHNVCDSVAYEMGLKQAIDDGWLVPIRQRFIQVDSLDLSKVKTVKGDLAEGARERAFLGDCDEDEERLLHAIAKPTIDEAAGRPTLVFAAGQEHAAKLTAAFNAYDGVTAEMVIDKTDKSERRDIIERYKRGETQILVNCMCFTEGFDAPKTYIIANARPTKAESLYYQIIGRGTRPLEGVVDGPDTAEARRAAIAASDKPNCVILDFVGNSGNHKLITVADVLAGDDVEPIDLESALIAAKEANTAVDMEELIEKAKTAREAKLKKQEEERLARASTRHKADRAQYTATDVDLFAGRKFNPDTDYTPNPNGPSVKQVALLVKLGVNPDKAMGMSRGQAGAVITKLKSKTGPDHILTFSKDHAGKPLKDVPTSFLKWCLDKEFVKQRGLDIHIRETLAIREGRQQPVDVPF
jgi:superfamily II DNA or RNA helicase